ncbi:hypothetical protein [Niabella hibiscisoli]|uniref:hypothetical protein n=1 Tax=Niabella hibiscisoli TaxID=1825928 RepID=UPI00293F49F7|nr:hypothetical protein [Niabella hibiscisoli]
MNTLLPADYVVFFVYFIAVAAYGYYIYRKKKSDTMSSNDFFSLKVRLPGGRSALRL